MKILFLQLSDIHIAKRQDVYAINIDKIFQAVNYFPDIDQCIIIVSGDITQNGKPNEFQIAYGMFTSLVYKIKERKLNKKYIKLVIVPGNHDLDLSSNKRTYSNITTAYEDGNIIELIENDINSLSNFYDFSYKNQCFSDDKMVSHCSHIFEDIRINFVLINTAPFSLEGSTNDDMGIHYLSTDHIGSIIPKIKADLNIAVMHHSSEWFNARSKSELNHILSDNFSIVFFGHEHDAIGEQRQFNSNHETIFIQGNTLSGDKTHNKGFIAAIYNTQNKNVKGYSFIWDKDIYEPEIIYDETIADKS